MCLMDGNGMATNTGIISTGLPISNAGTFIVAVGVVIANLVADILYAVVDPRIKLE